MTKKYMITAVYKQNKEYEVVVGEDGEPHITDNLIDTWETGPEYCLEELDENGEIISDIATDDKFSRILHLKDELEGKCPSDIEI